MAGMKWIGRTPIIGTLRYLDKGDLYLRKDVQVMAFNYVEKNCPEVMKGAKRFVDYRLPQLLHRNPDVQFITYPDITPTPFLQVILENRDNEVIVDLFGKQSHEIWEHLKTLFGAAKPLSEVTDPHYNKAMFGKDKSQFDCVCKIPGQFRCSSHRKSYFASKSLGKRDDSWSKDYLCWYSSGFYELRKRKEQLEEA